MKRFFYLIAAASMLFSSCLKNNVTRKYTIYTPIYETKGDVYAKIKMNPAQSMKNLGSFALYDNYVFVNEKEKGIHVIDASSSITPVIKGFIPIPGNLGIAVRNNVLLADCYTDLLSIDIKDIAQISLLNKNENLFTSRANMYGFQDGGKILVGWNKRDTVMNEEFDMGRNLVFMSGSTAEMQFDNSSSGNSNSTSSSMAIFTLVNNYMYAIDQYKLYALDVSTPSLPTLKSTTTINWNVETLFPFKDNLFIGTRTGMYIYSIQTPSQPTYMGQFNHANVCDPVIADDTHAFVTLRSGTTCNGFTNQLDILDISNMSSPTLVKSYPMQNPHGLSKDGKLLFICDGDAGLKLFDASNLNALMLKQSYPIFGKAIDIIASQGKAILITDKATIFLTYDTDFNVNLIGQLSKS